MRAMNDVSHAQFHWQQPGNGQHRDDPRDNSAFRAAWDKLANDPDNAHFIRHINGEQCEPVPSLAEVVAAFFAAGALFPQQVSDVIRICSGPMSVLFDLEADVVARWHQLRHEQIEGAIAKEEAHREGIPRPLSLAIFLKLAKQPEFLVEPLLQRGYLYTLTALTFHGKTTVLLLLAVCVALGRQFAGLHTQRGRVVLFAGENTDDTAEKLRVLCEFLGIDPEPVPITIIPGAFDMASSIEPALIATAAGGQVALVVIDTSAAYRFDENEDDNQTSKRWGQTLRRFTQIDGRPVVIVAAHPTKHAKERGELLPRGGGGFLNEVDSNLSLLADLEMRTTELHWAGKHRGPGFDPIGFELRDHPHPTWTYHDGKSVLMTVAVPLKQMVERNAEKGQTGKRGRPKKGIEGHTKKARDALANLLATNGRKGLPGVPPGLPAVTLKEWQDEFSRTAMIGKPSTRRSAFSRALKELGEKGLAARAGDYVWLTCPEKMSP
jgi:AAA domain